MSTLRHGHTKLGGPNSPTYNSWEGMRNRCNRPTHKKYNRYGGRGIKVCPSWLRFDNFLEDMGERPPGTTLDRIDSNGDYEPSNCRWADRFTQLRSNRKLTDEQVRAIRADPRSCRKIAVDYPVGHHCILDVKKGKTYTHVL